MALDDLKSDLGLDELSDTVGKYAGEIDRSTAKFRKGAKGQGSVIKAAKGNIFEFPVFISSSVPLDYATATTSLLEQVYASYLQMAISINPVIDNRTAMNGAQFSKFKSNTNKYLECVDTMYQQDACHNLIRNTDNVLLEFHLMNISDGEARIINEAVDYQPLSEFTHFFQEANRPVENGQNPQYDNPTLVQAGPDDDKTYKNPAIDSFANMEHLYYQIESLRRQVEEYDAQQQAKGTASGLGGTATNYNYREARAKLTKLEAEARKLQNETTDAMLTYDRERARLDNELKQAEINLKEAQTTASKNQESRESAKQQATLDKLTHERDLAKKKLDNYDQDHQREVEKHGKEMEKLQNDLDSFAEDHGLKVAKTKAEINQIEQRMKDDKRRAKWEKQDREADKYSKANQGRIRAPQFMDETKIQKLNTMKPLMMTVDMNVETKDGGMRGVQYIVGVKTHNRLVDADTLPEVVEYPLKEMNKITRKAKWRAGELKFFKDILFRVKQKKQTAIDSRDPKRKWYRRLYELAHMQGDAPAAAVINGESVIKTFFKDKLGKFGDSSGVIPNATIVMSKADVDIIKRETKIDMLKGSTAARFCKELFLIALVVIDNDAESIKLLMPDLHNDYEIHSLASVNRQIAQLDTAGTKTRDIFKVLG